jgi:hypothetical protein
MFSAAHTQILLYQYFKNDSEDPLAFKDRLDPKQEHAQTHQEATDQLNRMIKGLKDLGFGLPAALPPKLERLRNYSYPQFEVLRATNDARASPVSQALKEAVKNYQRKYRKSHSAEAFQFAGEDPWVSATVLISVRNDQNARHLNFNQFLALVVELPFGDLRNLRLFLEKHNYGVLKNEFLFGLWGLKERGEVREEVSSMPTYVFVGRAEEEGSAVGEWVMDIPTPIYNLHTPTRKSCVERGYPYVNYIVHERAEHFIQYDYEYVDLGLAVFLHSYLDRDIKQRLQTQAVGLTKLMESLDGADEEKLSEDFKSFRKTATEVAKISGTVPEIEMMGRRLTEKYSSPNPRLPSIFQTIAGDNKEFLESSVGAVVQSTKVLQDLFLVLFEKRSEEHRRRVESFLKVISAFAIVVVIKEIWRREDAKPLFARIGTLLTGRHWPSMVSAHPGYFYSSFLFGVGLAAVLWLYLAFEERSKLHAFEVRWKLRGLIVTLALSAPLVLPFIWPGWGSSYAFAAGLVIAAVISGCVGPNKRPEDGKKRFEEFMDFLWFFLAVAALHLYAWFVLWVAWVLF